MKMSRTLPSVAGLALLGACSSSNTSGPGTQDAGADAAPEGTTGVDAGAAEGGPDAGSTTPTGDGGAESGTMDAGAMDAAGDALPDAMNAVCSGDWLDASSLYPGITPDAGALILHAAGSGTQNYQCQVVVIDAGADASTYEWVFVGPSASLDDCNGQLIGHHFASEAGASAPEWQTLDGTYVIGAKKVSYTPDGGGSSIPWLLLEATSHGGTGTLGNAGWISRANTSGGVAPSMTCDDTNAGNTQDVSYTADYYFWGP